MRPPRCAEIRRRGSAGPAKSCSRRRSPPGALGLTAHATFSGALAWALFFYPWPPHNPQLLEEAFSELARRWRPILDGFDQQGVDLCYEIHPGEDLHDGVTFDVFCSWWITIRAAICSTDPSHLHLQQMDYLAYIDIYHQRIKAFHVKDAEFRRDGRCGVYGGYQNWLQRAGRFRSPGTARSILSGFLASSPSTAMPVGGAGVGVLPERGGGRRPRGQRIIRRHIIPASGRAFDDFAAGSEVQG
ncbi:Xylose isomerase-like TIM barrel [Raoultella terrigena]|uniref:Xylose isomerase-like TIM barrel n=1 Tax=Raoultella terrigena TaxID=577 RepID=A0A4U9DFD0_RAOTE|nr:Xylose isomerase-like TIM barrel [Raoultella terrigena]